LSIGDLNLNLNFRSGTRLFLFHFSAAVELAATVATGGHGGGSTRPGFAPQKVKEAPNTSRDIQYSSTVLPEEEEIRKYL
jgi:hypothetical protein